MTDKHVLRRTVLGFNEIPYIRLYKFRKELKENSSFNDCIKFLHMVLFQRAFR